MVLLANYYIAAKARGAPMLQFTSEDENRPEGQGIGLALAGRQVQPQSPSDFHTMNSSSPAIHPKLTM